MAASYGEAAIAGQRGGYRASNWYWEISRRLGRGQQRGGSSAVRWGWLLALPERRRNCRAQAWSREFRVWRSADLLGATKDHKEAIALYERAQKICKRVHGEESTQVGDVLAGIADQYETQGMDLGYTKESQALFEKSFQLYERALDIAIHTHGAQSVEVGTVLDSMASVRHSQDKLDEAFGLHERTLRIFEVEYGVHSSAVSTVLVNMATLHVRQGMLMRRGQEWPENPETPQLFEDALALNSRALKINERVYGAESSAAALALEGMAFVCYTLGRYKESTRDMSGSQDSYSEACKFYERALLIQEHLRKWDEVQRTRASLADIEKRLGDLRK